MRVTLLGKRWNLVFPKIPASEQAHGYCEPPDRKRKRLAVDKRLVGQHRLEIILHEMLHAVFWYLEEEIVAQMAKDMAKVLWDLGYRCEEES